MDTVDDSVDMVERLWTRACGEDAAAARREVENDGTANPAGTACYYGHFVCEILVAEAEGVLLQDLELRSGHLGGRCRIPQPRVEWI